MGTIPPRFLKRIEAAKEQQLKELDLSCHHFTDEDQKLTEIPAAVFELQDLEVLKLQFNRLTTIPDSITQLTNLTELYLSSNQLKEIPYFITQLTNLTHLYLSGNQIKEIPDSLTQLTNLSELYLSNNQLQEIPDSITQLTNLTELDLSNNQLQEIPDSITQLTKLTQLDLFGNEIKEIPDSITQLTNLTHLDLDGNQLNQIPECVFNIKGLTCLYLRNSQLKEIPDSITQLTNLTELSLWKNQIKEIPAYLTQLTNLTCLGLWKNQIKEIPAYLTQLTNLTYLDLSNNQLKEIPNSLTQLTNLNELYLWENQIKEIPNSITKLTNLTHLNLDGNQLNQIPECVFNIKGLTFLDLSENQLKEIPDSITKMTNLTELYLSNNQLKEIPDSITQMTNLTELYLGGNQLKEIPDSITKMTNLTELYLSNNQLKEIPDSITQMTNLTELYLSNNQIKEIPDCIANLTKLKYLNVSNNQIKSISQNLKNLDNLEGLKLEENPVKCPPLEVVAEGIEAIKDYFRQIEREGIDYLYEAKLLIIGEGGAGKTTLARKIKDINYQLQLEDSTQGIDVIEWHFDSEENQDFQVNIWDFGGQEIYHATHQFFLTKRSFYLLVADSRQEDTDFYYWLNVVELLSENSPLLIINNEKQDRQRDINERQLRGEFTNLEKTLATNLATNRGLAEIQREIKHYISSLPHVGDALPKSWVRVREALENNRHRNYISLDEYLNICRQNGFTRHRDKLRLSRYLHDLGVILHFHDDSLLKHIVILKPEWGTDAVYRVLDNRRVKQNYGQFNQADLDQIWHEEEYRLKQDELLGLMCKFKLCYQIPTQPHHYIAPQLLRENQPEYDWDTDNNLILRYTYEKFMPKGILTQFIVAMHRKIDRQQYVWKTGVILSEADTKAEVIEYYGRREITVKVVGQQKKKLLTIVTYELDQIHQSYKRLKYSQWIPCNCQTCQDSQEPHHYKFKILEKFYQDRQPQIQCQASYEMVNVLGLIDDVMDLREFVKDEEMDRESGFKRGRYSPSQSVKIIVNSTQENNQNQVEDHSMSTINQFGQGHNFGGDYVRGDKIGTQNNYSQNLTQAAQEIQQLLNQLSKQYDKTTIVGAKAIEEIEQNPTLKARVINALKEAGTTAIEELVDHPAVSIVMAGAKAFMD